MNIQEKTLVEFYQDYNTVKKLISLGDISFIDKKLEPETKSHTFDNPEEGVTVVYHRDRGEPYKPPRKQRI